MIEAIKASGRLSEAMNRAFADLETQRDSIRVTLVEVEKRANKRIGAAMLAEKIMVYAGDFARLWKDGLAIEERKELLRCYVHPGTAQFCNWHDSSLNLYDQKADTDLWPYPTKTSCEMSNPSVGLSSFD